MTVHSPQALLAELAKLETLRNDSRAATGQRQYQRFVVRGDAELRSMDRTCLDASPMQILLRDLSRGGIGFVSSLELERGSTWQACFLHKDYLIGSQGAIVRHCRKIENGLFLVGAQFCIETGLMSLAGIDPAAIRDGDISPELAAKPDTAFLPPGDVT
jgi:hypothetical protein